MTVPRTTIPLIPASRVVIVMPNWLGDGVMATPFLRTLRTLYPKAHIAAVARPLVAPVVEGLGLVDDLHLHPKGTDAAVRHWMKQQRFDLGILLPNSFRSAWMVWRAGVKRRVGYARDRRSWLLTDRIAPALRTPEQCAEDRRKSEAIRALGGGNVDVGSDYQPLPAIHYYMKLADYLSGTGLHPLAEKTPVAGPLMELGITEKERAEAAAALAAMQLAPGDRWITLVPGANFGSSKCWPPERFAALADQLIDPAGPFAVKVILAGSPAETPIVNAILAAGTQKQGLSALTHLNGGKGVSLGALKEIVRGSALMVCNDTGPRHFAAALRVPIVTLFGPTDPAWAETFVGNERIVRVDTPCGPCQLKKCPIDHRCMRGITVDSVLTAVGELWAAPSPTTGTAGAR